MVLANRSHREIVGIAQQTAANLGTPTDPVTHLIPVTSFSAKEVYEHLLDNGRRGPDSMDFRAIQGVKHVEISIEGTIQMNGTTGSAIGIFLRSILASGAPDAAGPYWTPIQINADAVYKHYRYLGTAHEYLTIQHNDRISATGFREFEGCRCTELTISFNSGEGMLTYSATLIGRDFTNETTTMADLSTQDETLEDPIAGWMATSVISAANTRLISAEWKINRSANRLYTTANQQEFASMHFGPIEATVSMVLDYSADTELDLFKAGTQIEIHNLFDYGATTTLRGFGISMLNASLLEAPAEVDSSGEQMTLALSARGLYSTTAGALSVDKSDSGTVNSQSGPIETLTEEQQVAGY